MFKELKNTDSQNLKAYVEFDNANLEEKKVYGSVFFNIVACLLGAFYINSAIIFKAVAVALSLFFVASMIWFKFKVSKTQTNIKLYFACYMTAISVILCYDSCLFFSKTGIGSLVPAVIYVIALTLVFIAKIKSECKKIVSGEFVGKSVPPIKKGIISGAAVLGTITSRFLYDKINVEIVLGFVFGFLGIVLGAGSRFFVKWYCHKLLEQRESE